MENKSFTDFAKSIAEERYKVPQAGLKAGSEIVELYANREAYEACINERVKPLYEALKEIESHKDNQSPAIWKILAQAIANFEGGVKVVEDKDKMTAQDWEDLISLAEDGYKLHVSNACHQEFLKEDLEILSKAKKQSNQ